MPNPNQTCDYLIIGGGVVGLALARDLQRRFAEAKVIVLEKEPAWGKHASGRNSGVIHAGFYYAKDSLKARLTRDGNRLLTAFCEEEGLPIRKCGKLVVARDEADIPQLELLLERAQANQVPLVKIDAGEAKAIEPRVKTHRWALFSPTTSSINPLDVMDRLAADAKSRGVDFQLGNPYIRRIAGNRILTGQGAIEAGFIINAAGLFADRIARDFAFSADYAIVPFKGIYLTSAPACDFLRTNIYPVPDLRNPFLGVHFTVTCDGRVKIGSTAIPALWREQYGGMQGFSLGEAYDVLKTSAVMFRQRRFQRLALQEWRKYFRSHLVAQSRALVDGVDARSFKTWAKPGIRAQLFDLRKKTLEMDFIWQADSKSLHVLNAVSPAFTCSLSLSRYLLERVEAAQRSGGPV